MHFKEMKAEDRAKLIEEHDDVLTPLIQEDQKIYEDASCPRCGGMAAKDVDLFRAVTTKRVIPRYNCKCLECGCLFEPITGLIIEMGNLGRLHPETLVPIVGSGDH